MMMKQDPDMSMNSMTDVTDSGTGKRDEILEIRKQSQKETARVRVWRILATLALLATAVAVTVTTYMLLADREDQNFRNVVSMRSYQVLWSFIKYKPNVLLALLFILLILGCVSITNFLEL